MARSKQTFECTACGWTTSKWAGKCRDCGEWNTMEEASKATIEAAASKAKARQPTALPNVTSQRGGEVRVRTTVGELDRVLGGGQVSGSLVLLGGDPGVGKSTLLLMALDGFARRGLTVLYVTAEESLQQVKMRADRLGVVSETLMLLAETDWARIEATVHETKPAVLVIDSVQTVAVPTVGSVPGSVGQVREVAHRAMMLAKSAGIATWLVGHITKSGQIAGPKVLEHLVDTVLYFEGDGSGALRTLRAVKNRFGAAGEIGMFEMSDAGLIEVPDASARLLAERISAPGTAVTAALEGSRPLLCEVQALVGHPSPANPARTCVGVDRARVLMLIAVLGKLGLPLHDRDVFVNAAGGVKLMEPAADLAIVAAIASSMWDKPLPEDVLCFGEVGLAGEVRGVAQPIGRLREAARHGFSRVLAPARIEESLERLELIRVKSAREALASLKG